MTERTADQLTATALRDALALTTAYLHRDQASLNAITLDTLLDIPRSIMCLRALAALTVAALRVVAKQSAADEERVLQELALIVERVGGSKP